MTEKEEQKQDNNLNVKFGHTGDDKRGYLPQFTVGVQTFTISCGERRDINEIYWYHDRLRHAFQNMISNWVDKDKADLIKEINDNRRVITEAHKKIGEQKKIIEHLKKYSETPNKLA